MVGLLALMSQVLNGDADIRSCAAVNISKPLPTDGHFDLQVVLRCISARRMPLPNSTTGRTRRRTGFALSADLILAGQLQGRFPAGCFAFKDSLGWDRVFVTTKHSVLVHRSQ